MSLEERLKARIRQDGPMTVADYMAACLFDPKDGYYAVRPRLGAQGDFVTAPLISQMFGELLGLWAVETWRRLGAPERFRLVEVGPGDTLWEIAVDAAPSGQVRDMVRQIQELNALSGPGLTVGQEIAVPVG